MPDDGGDVYGLADMGPLPSGGNETPSDAEWGEKRRTAWEQMLGAMWDRPRGEVVRTTGGGEVRVIEEEGESLGVRSLEDPYGLEG